MRFRRKIKIAGRSNAPVNHEAFLKFGNRSEPLKGSGDFEGALHLRDFAPELYGYRRMTEREFGSYILRQTNHWFLGVAMGLALVAWFTNDDGRMLSLLLAQIAFAGWIIQYPALFLYAMVTAKSREVENDTAIERLRTAHPLVENKRVGRLTKLYGGDADLIERDVEHRFNDLAKSLDNFDMNVSFELRGTCLMLNTDLPEIEEVAREDRDSDLDRDYATGVVGLAFNLATRAFNVSPSVRFVEVMGYTHGKDRILGKPRDENIYRIVFDRETMAGLNLGEMEPLQAMKAFRYEMNVKPKHWLERIEVHAVAA